jgi:hypothetical protein
VAELKYIRLDKSEQTNKRMSNIKGREMAGTHNS